MCKYGKYEMVDKRRLFILFSILFFVIAITCAPEIDAGDNHVSTIPSAEFAIEGISIGSTYKEITDRLGEPVKVVKEIITGGPGLLVYYDGMEIVISADEAVNIRITGKGYRMKNGIEVGSSMQYVFNELGKAEITLHNGRDTARYTVLTPQGYYADAELIIYFKDDTVDEIVFYFAYV